MCDNRGYFVFTYDSNGAVSNMAGTTRQLYPDSTSLYGTDEQVTLPKAFMMGSTYNARVYRSEAGRPVAAVIPIDSAPLAL